MILKALYDYYNRCEGLSAKGLEQKEIGYLIVIDKDGTFVRIESRMKDKKTIVSNKTHYKQLKVKEELI